jgi:hypothetical protein
VVRSLARIFRNALNQLICATTDTSNIDDGWLR